MAFSHRRHGYPGRAPWEWHPDTIRGCALAGLEGTECQGDQGKGINRFIRKKAPEGTYKKQMLYLCIFHLKWSRNFPQPFLLVINKTPLRCQFLFLYTSSYDPHHKPVGGRVAIIPILQMQEARLREINCLHQSRSLTTQ